MCESSGSQFFRTNTEIQSGPDAFNESKFSINFLTILGVIEILCSFRLVLEGKAGKEIPKSTRLQFLSNNFALSEAEDNTPRLLKILLTIYQKYQEPGFWKVMDSFFLLEHESLEASRSLLQRLIACLNFTLDLEDVFCWYKGKNHYL